MFNNKQTIDKLITNHLSKYSERERNQQGYRVAKLYYNVQEYELARKYVSLYLTVVPDSAVAHRLLAECSEKLNRKDAALRAYRISLELDPTQKDLLLKVCELMIQEDTGLDQSNAEYWCDKAKEYYPNHPTLFTLKERIVKSKSNDTNRGDEIENLILTELAEDPTNVSLRIRLLRQLLNSNKIKEAYKHAFDIVNLKFNIFADNLNWYEIVAEILGRYQVEVKLDYQFWIFYIIVLDKIAGLSLSSEKTLSACCAAVFKLDQVMNEAIKDLNKVDRLLFQEFTKHFLGQICLHLATLNYKRSDSEYNVSLLLGAWVNSPPEISAGWLAQTESDIIRKWVNNWYVEACFRASQSGHLLLHALQKNKLNVLTGNWRERFFKNCFNNQEYLFKMKSSYFLNCSQLKDLRVMIPGSAELTLYDETAQLLHPTSLHHVVWLALNSKLSEFKCHIFDGLQFSVTNLKNCGAETINQLDILAFIYCTTICVQNNKLKSDAPRPVSITEQFCTPTQENWFSTLYKVYKRDCKDLTNLRLTLIHGIETVRCVGNHGLHVGLLVDLAKLFMAQEENTKKETTKRDLISQRAILYWNTAIPLLERLKLNHVIKYPSKAQFFDYHKELTPNEISTFQEEGKLYLACKFKENGDYNQALEMFQTLKSPYATFYQAQIYKKLAQAQLKHVSEHVTSEMRSQHIIYLSKARDCFYLTLDRLREPHFDRKHPLNLELGNEIEHIEAQLSQIDPDLNDENLSNVSSQSERNRTVHLTPFRTREARPSPERLDAQIRQIITKDSVITNILDQNRQLLENYKKLSDEIRDMRDEIKNLSLGSSLQKLQEDIAKLNLGPTLQKIQVDLSEIKNDMRKDPPNEQDLYDVLEEDYRMTTVPFHYPMYVPPYDMTSFQLPKNAPPVNVVITNSEPLPTQSVPQTQLSVTIPPQHLHKPHNYQIPLPILPQLPTQLPQTTPQLPHAAPLPVTTSNILSTYSSPPKYSAITSPEPEEIDPCPDFKPIIPLPDEVDVKTGEENETVLFKERAKIFRWVQKEWKERGIGDLKILHNTETGKVRILMRREQVHKICANHFLTSDMELQTMSTSDRAFIWAANDFADEEMRLEKLSVKFKSPEIAEKFKTAFNEAKKLLTDTNLNVSNKTETPVKVIEKANVSLKTPVTPVKVEKDEGKKLGGFTFSSAPAFDNVQKKEQEIPKTETKVNPFSNFSFGATPAVSSPFSLFGTPEVSDSPSVTITPVKSGILSSLLSTPVSSKSESVIPITPVTPTTLTSPEKTADDFVPTAEFTPVIALPELVEAKTGEEDETVLFCERAKLFRFDTNTKEWKERGLGEMKILASGIVRLLMRREHILKICCNHQVTKTMEFNKVTGNEKAVRWAAQDFSENELKSEVFTIRFKTPDLVDKFLEMLKKVQGEMDEGNFLEDPDSSVSLVTSPVATKQPSKEIEKPKDFSEFKPKPGAWECKNCYISNNSTAIYCIACESPKDPSIAKKPAGITFDPNAPKFTFGIPPTSNSTPISQIVVPNETEKPVNLSKELEKPKAFSEKPKDFSEFKPKAGSWECKTCYISNTTTAVYCVACETPKDPNMPKKPAGVIFDQNAPKFSFGIPSTQTPTTSVFGTPTSTSSIFGTPKSSLFGTPTISSPFGTPAPLFGTPAPLFGTPAPLFGSPANPVPESKTGFQFNTGEKESELTLGSSEKFQFGFKPRSPRKSESGVGGEDSDGEAEEDDGEHIYFKPVIPLPEKIEVKTGEEDEDIVYCHRGKLFRFVGGEWKERGVGDLKILKHKETEKLRILMRREPIMKICLNHALTADIEYRVKDDKSWLFSAPDFSEGQISQQQFCIRFKTPEMAKDFRKAVDDARAALFSENDCEFISPIIPEDLIEKAKSLQLPELFYLFAIDGVPACAGCIGCDPDNYEFKPVKTEVTEKPKESVKEESDVSSFSFSNEFKTIGGETSIFGSGTPKTIFGSSNNGVGAANFSFGSKVAETPKSSFVAKSTFETESSTPRLDTKPTENIFGTNSSKHTFGTSIFGSKPAENSPIFGDSPSIFGGKPTTENVPAFGSKTEVTTNIFGASSGGTNILKPSTFAFSGTSLFGANSPSTTTTSIFGGNTPSTTTGSLFGGNTPSSTKGSLFSGNTPTNTTSSLFGGNTSTNTTTTSLFGGNTPSNTATSLFGGNTPATTTSSLFGGNTSSTTTSSIFGKSSFSTTTSIFAGNTTSTTSIFGGKASTSTTSTFGGNSPSITTATTTSETASTNLFAPVTASQPIVSTESSDDNNIFGLKTSTATLDFASIANTAKPAFNAPSNFQFEGAGSLVFSHLKPKKEDDEEQNDGDYDPHYEPIIPLPDKIVVSTGEEDEQIVYSTRAKLYKYDAGLKEWKERGVGTLKILHHVERGTYRFILRREQVHKLVLNQLLRSDLTLQKMNSSNQAYCWGGMNYAEEEGVLEELAVKFKNQEIAEEFYAAVEDCKNKLQEMVPTTIAECLDNEDDEESYEDEEYEDEEDYLQSLMSGKPCTLYEELDGTWQEIAKGNVQIVYDSQTYYSRISVVTSDGEIITNCPILKDMDMTQEGDVCLWTTTEDMINPDCERTLRAKFESVQDAAECYINFKEGIELAH